MFIGKLGFLYSLREFDINQKIAGCPSLIKFTSMAGFFSKQRQAAIADNESAMKFLFSSVVMQHFLKSRRSAA